MNKRDKIKFVKTRSKLITDSIIESIKSGKVPVDWNETELGWLLADKYAGMSEAPIYLSGRKRVYVKTVVEKGI